MLLILGQRLHIWRSMSVGMFYSWLTYLTITIRSSIRVLDNQGCSKSRHQKLIVRHVGIVLNYCQYGVLYLGSYYNTGPYIHFGNSNLGKLPCRFTKATGFRRRLKSAKQWVYLVIIPGWWLVIVVVAPGRILQPRCPNR